DHVIFPGDKPKIALIVAIDVVASPVPAIRSYCVPLLFRVAPIKRSRWTSDQKMADLPRRRFFTFFVCNLDLEARHDCAERTRPSVHLDCVRCEHIHHLGRSQTLEDL